MRSCRVLVGALVLVGSLSPVAGAHPISSFRGCVVAGGSCRWQSGVLADGSTARLVGIPAPRHSGAIARVWRSDPLTGEWAVVGTTIVHRWGKIRWSWQVELADARNEPYRFRFEIPGHGASTIAHLGVRDATDD